MNKVAKERIIFDNYDTSQMYKNAKEFLLETHNEEDISENDIWEEVYWNEQVWFDDEYEQLKSHFNNAKLFLVGSIGRWNGVSSGAKIFDDFESLFQWATQDCDYIKIYDINGHLHITCSHHDGTCNFEVKEITDKGKEYYDNWDYDYIPNDKRSERDIHRQLYKRYTRLPHYAKKMFGCKTREYEPQTKETIIRTLNNQAKSFYC